MAFSARRPEMQSSSKWLFFALWCFFFGACGTGARTPWLGQLWGPWPSRRGLRCIPPLHPAPGRVGQDGAAAVPLPATLLFGPMNTRSWPLDEERAAPGRPQAVHAGQHPHDRSPAQTVMRRRPCPCPLARADWRQLSWPADDDYLGRWSRPGWLNVLLNGHSPLTDGHRRRVALPLPRPPCGRPTRAPGAYRQGPVKVYPGGRSSQAICSGDDGLPARSSNLGGGGCGPRREFGRPVCQQNRL